jgi:hypothetical protein
MNVFTIFSKGVDGSLGLSFCESAKHNCDPQCRLWRSCYACRIERMYKCLRAKLRRHHRNGPTWVVNQAIKQWPDKPVPWFRFSVDGSFPSRSKVRNWRTFRQRLRLLVIHALGTGSKVHIPVESKRKAMTYRAVLRGIPVVVRRTSQARTVEQLISEDDPRAWVAATAIHNGGVSKTQVSANIDLARQSATAIRANGETAVVCSAIAGSSHCGQCTACADERVSVVIYPFHP